MMINIFEELEKKATCEDDIRHLLVSYTELKELISLCREELKKKMCRYEIPCKNRPIAPCHNCEIIDKVLGDAKFSLAFEETFGDKNERATNGR